MALSKKLAERGRRLGNIFRTLASQAGLDRSYAKVFLLGFNKTATSSMHRLFQQMGLDSFHSPKWIDPRNRLLLYRHQAFSDGAPLDFDRLDRMFPRSKFILNVRDLDQWIDSRLEHIREQERQGTLQRSRYWSDTPEAVREWIMSRNTHHLAVMRYFRDRSEDLLILNYIRDPDAVTRISGFLGIPAPADKPHAQPMGVKLREDGVLSNREMIHEQFTALGVPESEFGKDLFCPSLVGGDAAEGLPSDTSEIAGFQAVSPGR